MGLLLFLLFFMGCLIFLGLIEFSGYFGTLGLFSYPGCLMNGAFTLDSVSLGCFIMLSVCSFAAFFYCFHYFGGINGNSVSIFPLMVWFVGVMGVLVFSSSLLFTLIMWEYLGFVSFILILFYSNMYSLRSALITLFSSRFGDVGLFILVVSLYMGLGNGSVVLVISLLLIILTKSAGYPFSSWLLEAMRAPTPVSSLVHSSTLVAAGVWFLMRYSDIVCVGPVICGLYICSVISVLITGVCSLWFLDLKKIVALSTCNNISWCLIFFVWGHTDLVLLQLVTHGVCKCLMFILVGDLMTSSNGSQLSLGVYSLTYGGWYGGLLLSCLVFSLCGLPFLGIFFSKHFFLSCVLGGSFNGLVVFTLYVGFFLSYAYSSRLILLLVGVIRGLSSGFISSFLLVSWSVILGTLINLVWGGCFIEYSSLGILSCLLFLMVQLAGCLVGVWYFLCLTSTSSWISWLFGSDLLVNWCYGLFDIVRHLGFLGTYRWEIYLFGFFSRLGLNHTGLGLFSINFLIMGGLLCFIIIVLS